MIQDRRRSSFVALVWLALATVLANALAPTGSPLLRVSGSAFNPFTTDVALGPKRGAVVERASSSQSASDHPDDMASPDVPLLVPSVALPLPQLHSLPDAGAPRLASSLPGLRGFRARAPPLA